MKLTKEDKELLVRDLSARLPYGVICDVSDDIIHECYTLDGLTKGGCEFGFVFYGFNSFDIKPYLRSKDSMTEIERDEYHRLQHDVWHSDMTPTYYDSIKSIDWLLEHHFDYRGLIHKGLAIKVTDDNNPYKQEDEK